MRNGRLLVTNHVTIVVDVSNAQYLIRILGGIPSRRMVHAESAVHAWYDGSFGIILYHFSDNDVHP